MILRVTSAGKAKRRKTRSRSESESEQGEIKSVRVDAKPGDLPLGRLKAG